MKPKMEMLSQFFGGGKKEGNKGEKESPRDREINQLAARFKDVKEFTGTEDEARDIATAMFNSADSFDAVANQFSSSELVGAMKKHQAEKHSNNPELATRIANALEALNSGDEQAIAAAGLEKLIKTTPTILTDTHKNSPITRYRPGQMVKTYVGFNPDGSLQQEAGYEEAVVKEGDVVAVNKGRAIRYPEGHQYAGQEVRGYYDKEGTFLIDQEDGTMVLQNEYVIPGDVAEAQYGFKADVTPPGEYLKLEPSYAFTIPEGTKNATLTGMTGNTMDLYENGKVIFNVKKGKVQSVQGLAPDFLDTYMPYDEYLKNLKGE